MKNSICIFTNFLYFTAIDTRLNSSFCANYANPTIIAIICDFLLIICISGFFPAFGSICAILNVSLKSDCTFFKYQVFDKWIQTEKINIEEFIQELKEIQPDVLYVVPRVLELIKSKVESPIE